MKTSAPAAAKPRAMALPRPLLPPVTRAVRPERLNRSFMMCGGVRVRCRNRADRSHGEIALRDDACLVNRLTGSPLRPSTSGSDAFPADSIGARPNWIESATIGSVLRWVARHLGRVAVVIHKGKAARPRWPCHDLASLERSHHGGVLFEDRVLACAFAGMAHQTMPR